MRFKRGRGFSTFAVIAAALFVYGRTHKRSSSSLVPKPVPAQVSHEQHAAGLTAGEERIAAAGGDLGIGAVRCEVRTWLDDGDVEVVPDDPGAVLPAVWSARVADGVVDTVVPAAEGSAKLVREGVAVGSMHWDHALAGDVVPCIGAAPLAGGQARAAAYEHPPADEAAREAELQRALASR